MTGEVAQNKYFSRKFIVCGVVFATATLLRLVELIEGSDWTNIAITCVGAYNVANAITNRPRS